MPTKSNSSNKKSKSGMSSLSKSGGMQKSQDRLERSVAPTTTADPDKQKVNKEIIQRDKKELISSFQNQLELKQQENDREIRITLEKINHLRKENERMQRHQMAEYGVTLDMLGELKVSLDKTKSQNDKLHEDMIEAKEIHDKLEIDLKKTQRKYNDTMREMHSLQKMTTVWDDTHDELLKTEARCDMLTRNNKKLKLILLKNHIDPSTDPREFSRELQSDKVSVRSNKTFPETYPKRKLTVRSKVTSIGDVDATRKVNEEDSGRKTLTLDRVNPAYLGIYTKSRQSKRVDGGSQSTYFFRTGTNLPRIIFG